MSFFFLEAFRITNYVFFFQAEDGIRDADVTGVQTCALPISLWRVADPGNVGTLIRCADAFGAFIALSRGCADPTSPRALRGSAGAVFRVPLLGFEEAPGPR